MFEIIFDKKSSKDLEKVSKKDLPIVLKTIHYKLGNTPQLYGKNLRGGLKDYRGLRVLKYRVIFKILRKKVYVLAIDHRQEVYEKALKRVI